ncbi:MAG: AmmeMemoRadiSam system protein B [Caldilineaceae bacterium]|nr:AmmeMemoRadiSam system protein B [Caldilineaceae bacterium]
MTAAQNHFCPRLRPLDIRPHVQDGVEYFALHDPLQLAEGTLLVPQTLAPLLTFCDGAHDAPAMAALFRRYVGQDIDGQMVQSLLAALDENCLLENARSDEAAASCLQLYRTAAARPMLLAGRSYPADADALRHYLDGLLAGSDVEPLPLAEWPRWGGVLSPHIDYARGGRVYADIWQRAADLARAAELVVLIGTDHYGAAPLTLTRQHYATPYGVLPTAREMVEAVAAETGEEAVFAGELRHRDEHSLELVAVWLHHMRRGEPVPVLPVLTGLLDAHVNASGQYRDELLADVLARIRDLAGSRRVLVVASGDLAHMGPAFGGAPLNGRDQRALQRADEELLVQMQTGSGPDFYRTIAATGNARNICGLAPVYLTLRLLEEPSRQPLHGEQFGYAVCPADPQNTSVVTVAGMTFM